MKELSIEEKAKAYDVALENAKHYHNEMGDDICCVLEECFPVLKESEDEVMRAMAIKAVHAPEAQSCIKSWGINPNDVIAWLEKQGEQNLIMAKSPQLGEQKPAWSEEDESMFDLTLFYLDRYVKMKDVSKCEIWLKSLKGRVQPNQEWNQGENTYNKVLSELLHKVICTFINDPDIPYFDREKVSMEVLPYVERLEKQGEQEINDDEDIL